MTDTVHADLTPDSRIRVWWIPQIPMKAFRVSVDSIEEGARLLEVLAQYDLFQYNERVKPDYSNAGGLTFYDAEDDDWNDIDLEDEEDVKYARTRLLQQSLPPQPAEGWGAAIDRILNSEETT